MLGLKMYQQDALDRLEEFFRELHGDAGTPRVAFDRVLERHDDLSSNRPRYRPANDVEPDVPYVCIRIPTGGGKTLVAAHAVGVTGSHWLRQDLCVVIWLVPTDAIRSQTLAALRDRNHPYREALERQYPGRVTVLDVEEALYRSRADYDGTTVVIVATMSAFRAEKKEGRRVYRQNGQLMSHVSGLTPEQEARLTTEDGADRISLVNALRLRRPLLIVDEAHNNNTPLSYRTLARFRPSAIVEFTATPAAASNVLYHVSALALKQEGMIKLPVVLQQAVNTGEALAHAKALQADLELAASREQPATGDYIRPIVLVQAQPRKKGEETDTADQVAEMLVKDHGIPPDQVVVHTGDTPGLNKVGDVMQPDSPVRFVITQQALREGWDCPFAYILCSLARQRSETSVEQILGRVLRMPRATPRINPVLNRAYAIVTEPDFVTAANALTDALVKNGFERWEAERVIKEPLGLDMFTESTTVLTAPPLLDSMLPETRRKVEYNPDSGIMTVRGIVSDLEVGQISSALGNDVDRESFETTVLEQRAGKSSGRSARLAPSERGMRMAVPILTVRQGDIFEELTDDHIRAFDWRLSPDDADGVAFHPPRPPEARLIDISDSGMDKEKLRVAGASELVRELDMFRSDEGWDEASLAGWLDLEVRHTDQPQNVTAVFFSRMVEKLLESGIPLADLVRHKMRLRDAARELYDGLRRNAHSKAAQALFADLSAFRVDPLHVMIFSERQGYAPGNLYGTVHGGRLVFQKHFFPIVGEMNSEEERVAELLDRKTNRVKHWVRNLERKPGSFWLQTSTDRFYPDFVAELDDGRILAVEYKGFHHRESDTAEKEKIGKVWASASDGKCLFEMVFEHNYEKVLGAIVH